jgi:serine/threonine-protein kinase
MKELGFRIGKSVNAWFPNQDKSQKFTPVSEGPGTRLRIDRDRGLEIPVGTIISGELFFGTDRIHGRFTQLHTPDGRTYPICMVLVNRSDRLGVGGQDVKQGEKPGTALISDLQGVKAVERFE